MKRISAHYRQSDGRTHWPRIMETFLRAAAVLWLAASVIVWAEITGALPSDGTTIADGGMADRLRAGLFAVVYPAAAVGLWLLASWGVVLFILSILAQVGIAVAFAGALGIDPLTIAANLSCLVVWATLAFQVRRNPVIEKARSGGFAPERGRPAKGGST